MQITEIVTELLIEFKDQRNKIKEMVVEIEKLAAAVQLLFPETIDARTRRFLEDKVKTMVAFYNVLLDMRKEISKSVKEELEVRRRLESEDFDPDDIDELLDIRDLSKKIEKFEKAKRDVQNKRLAGHRGIKELEEKGIDVPGLKELKELDEGEL